jgi:hypothetical protein
MISLKHLNRLLLLNNLAKADGCSGDLQLHCRQLTFDGNCWLKPEPLIDPESPSDLYWTHIGQRVEDHRHPPLSVHSRSNIDPGKNRE